MKNFKNVLHVFTVYRFVSENEDSSFLNSSAKTINNSGGYEKRMVLFDLGAFECENPTEDRRFSIRSQKRTRRDVLYYLVHKMANVYDNFMASI